MVTRILVSGSVGKVLKIFRFYAAFHDSAIGCTKLRLVEISTMRTEAQMWWPWLCAGVTSTFLLTATSSAGYRIQNALMVGWLCLQTKNQVEPGASLTKHGSGYLTNNIVPEEHHEKY
jgi:hypothetical protein